jgi:uncharacterized protein (UPF0332 family)
MTNFSKADYAKYRLNKAHETLSEVPVLMEKGYWNTAVNRLYYACFYAVGALLILNGVETSTHSGLRQKFGQMFVSRGLISKEFGKHYSELFEKRQKGDCDDFFDVDEERIRGLFQPSVDLIM